jgi:hypothetical protein
VLGQGFGGPGGGVEAKGKALGDAGGEGVGQGFAAVGEAVAYMAGLPLEANVQFMTVMATAMPFIGRG